MEIKLSSNPDYNPTMQADPCVSSNAPSLGASAEPGHPCSILFSRKGRTSVVTIQLVMLGNQSSRCEGNVCTKVGTRFNVYEISVEFHPCVEVPTSDSGVRCEARWLIGHIWVKRVTQKVLCNLCANGSYVCETSYPRDHVGYMNRVPGYQYSCQSLKGHSLQRQMAWQLN